MVAERELRLDECHLVPRPHSEGEYHAVAYDHSGEHHCAGDEELFADCPMDTFTNNNCHNSEDIGLACYNWDEDHYGIYRPEPMPDTMLDLHWETA
jgi:hypothetical protein